MDDKRLVKAMDKAFWGLDLDDWDEDMLNNMRAALTIARKALTSSPTPYVRPAADIQAEIERARQRIAVATAVYAESEEIPRMRGVIDALQWALTPPTREPR